VAAEGVATWMSAHGHKVAIYTDSKAPSVQIAGQSPGIRRYIPKKPWWKHSADEHARQSSARKAIWHFLDHLPHQGLSEFAGVVRDFQPDLVMEWV